MTVAIPHYRQEHHLKVVLESLFAQESKDFEIVLSDDHSPEGSPAELEEFLRRSSRDYQFFYQPTNLGYDGNVRFCLRAARGRFTFLLGNDDALRSPQTVGQVVEAIKDLGEPDVLLTNVVDYTDRAQVDRRATSTKVLGTGVDAALRYFRSFSFVSGLIYRSEAAKEHETDRWDGSIYYQIYLACRILAAGGSLAGVDIPTVRKDVRIQGQTVETYEQRAERAGWSLQRRHLGLDSVIRVTVAAVEPYLSTEERAEATKGTMEQIFKLTYPYWLLRYRTVANWSFAFGVAREMWPRRQLAQLDLPRRDQMEMWALYLAVTLAGLTLPLRLLKRLETFVRHRTRTRVQGPEPSRMSL